MITELVKINCGNTYEEAKAKASKYKEAYLMFTLQTEDGRYVSTGLTKAELKDMLEEFEE